MPPAVNRTPAVVARHRGIEVLLALVWFTVPWSDARLGQGLVLADAFMLVAVLGLVVLGSSRVDRPGRVALTRATTRMALGVGLLTAGMVIGELRTATWASDVPRTLLQGVAALLPLLLLRSARADRRLRSMLATAFVLGTAVSVAFGLLGAVNAQGRMYGLATHMNQLGMTIVISVALLGLAFTSLGRARWWARGAAFALFLVGLNSTGSRSGVYGTAVVLAVMLAMAIRSRPGRLVPYLVAGLVIVPLGLAVFSASRAGDDFSALGRITNEDQRVRDTGREALLDVGLESLTLDRAAIGGGYFLDRAPHNIYLETLLVGGAISVVGLALAYAPPVWWALRALVVRGEFQRHREVALLSVAVLGYLVAVFFNNALWPRFPWAVLALAVVARSDVGRAEPEPQPSMSPSTASAMRSTSKFASA